MWVVETGIEPNVERSGPGDVATVDVPTDDAVRERSWSRGEPAWLLDLRLEALRRYREQRPSMAGDRSATGGLDVTVPGTAPGVDRDGAAAGRAQRESESVFSRQVGDLARRGVVFCDMDTAVKDHPELVRSHLATLAPIDGNPSSALNTAVWSGGSFVYVPPGVEVEVPLQSLVRTGDEHERPFERTLVVADEGSRVQYIEGCLAPVYTADPQRCPVVEVVVGSGADVTFTSIRNLSGNVSSLETARARVEAEATLRWIDGTIGSRLTRKHPIIRLVGARARAEVLSAAYAASGQRHDTGATLIHAASETSSRILSRSISTAGGRSTFRGTVRVSGDVGGCTGDVRCDALVLDGRSFAEPQIHPDIGGSDARVHHEAATRRISGEQLFYLMSRGLSEQQAVALVVNGFIEPITGSLPTEYAVEWSRVIELNMEGSVG